MSLHTDAVVRGVLAAGLLVMPTVSDPRPSFSEAGAQTEACTRFETALLQGSAVRIEDFLVTERLTPSPELIVALAEIELRHRLFAGLRPDIEEYVQRFPTAGDSLRQALVPFLSSLDPDQPTIEQPRSPAVPAPPKPADGVRWVGRYQLIKQVGKGAFGEVWEALDPVLNRSVALKLLRRDRCNSQHDIDSLIEEGQRLSHLDHAGIVPIFDAAYGVDGHAFLASKFMPGGTLEARLRAGPISLTEAITIAISVAEGLQHAHEHEIVHRDIKPSNILFDADGRARLGDFGLAASEQQQLGEKPGAAGTLGYMSPEQARGETHLCGPRADLYSLGVVLYRMLTGRLPFIGSDWVQYREQILKKEPPAPRSLDPEIPTELESLVLRCLRKDAADRPATALEVGEMLKSWQAGALSEKPPYSRTRNGWLIAALSATLPMLAGLLLLMRTGDRLPVAPQPHPEVAAPVPTIPGLPKTVTRSWKNPELIAWTPQSRRNHFQYDSATNSFRIDPFDDAMFRVAEAQSEDIELSTTFEMDETEGVGGLFWALDTSPFEEVHCWSVLVGRYRANGSFLVEIREQTLQPLANNFVVRSSSIVTYRKIERDPVPTVRLSAKVSRSSVKSITLDDREILAEPVALPAREWVTERSRGAGFMSRGTPLSILKFECN